MSKRLDRPRILLVGAGRFGTNHLRVLKELEARGKIILEGVVIRDERRRASIADDHKVAVFPDLSPAVLMRVDAVDIVTPPETHREVAEKCLPYAHVFIEKPLATSKNDANYLLEFARKTRKKLFVGHIYRYHQVTHELARLLKKKGFPNRIEGSFINPVSTDQRREPSLELLHLFDIVDAIWGEEPKSVFARKEGRVTFTDARYGRKCNAHFTLGWRNDEKTRALLFVYPDVTVHADFVSNTIEINRKTDSQTLLCTPSVEPLYAELDAFAASIAGGSAYVVDGQTGARIVGIAERAIGAIALRPSIAVIGGGIFGTSVAAEVCQFADVTLFEKASDLMTQGSFINQFRHHRGYHYPRSDDTVYDIERSRGDFEEVFRGAIDDESPTYYGVALKDSLVTASEFVDFCKKHSLPYEEAYPEDEFLNKSEMEMCVRVPEPNYNHDKMREIARKRLEASPSVRVLYDTVVTGCALTKEGRKSITFRHKDGETETERFDFVINATYANINKVSQWLGSEKYPMRIDLAQVLIVRLPIEPISLTVIDGPFATLMPTGRPHEFTLYHVKESILDRYVPDDGFVKSESKIALNTEAILTESAKLFPILKHAEIVESRVVNRGVRAHHEHDDKRVADLVSNGFGCWSILSGKIISSVTTAKRVASIIMSSLPSETLYRPIRFDMPRINDVRSRQSSGS